MAQPVSRGAQPDNKYVIFMMKDEEYGLEVLKVHEIVRIESIIPVPHSRPYFLGMMDIRGKVIPIIDLKGKLELDEGGTGNPDRAIIIEVEKRRIGLAVDRVSSVVQFRPEDIDQGPPAVKSVHTRYISGIGKLKERFIVLMNLDHLFSGEELSELFSQQRVGKM
ncbi:MAG: purine-binding chemotaxis protein CheW [Leptonema illini]|jgi:purine-binding chemotaxis protein CheW|uniref:CheW protein n=2 Tax=Leptonema illini TaxID=183 RepID=H2CFW2_9LEPT|nr:chemotaxis protein CheW [Leptonema illini]EHQ06811.1 CheW protein [Leptonema illini DSM 21528]KAB2929012.1 MAG: purine-binding chemotaxis protein CheW [Leptonema illini]PKL32495.1 MAG: chemotaxis protein CheW [Spirochaetae bacterium HGW-Spirochaetae-10]